MSAQVGVTGHRAISGIVALCLDIALVSTFNLYSTMAQHESKFASPCCSLEDIPVMLWAWVDGNFTIWQPWHNCNLFTLNVNDCLICASRSDSRVAIKTTYFGWRRQRCCYLPSKGIKCCKGLKRAIYTVTCKYRAKDYAKQWGKPERSVLGVQETPKDFWFWNNATAIMSLEALIYSSGRSPQLGLASSSSQLTNDKHSMTSMPCISLSKATRQTWARKPGYEVKQFIRLTPLMITTSHELIVQTYVRVQAQFVCTTLLHRTQHSNTQYRPCYTSKKSYQQVLG